MHVIIQEIYFIESIDGRVENKLGTGALQIVFHVFQTKFSVRVPVADVISSLPQMQASSFKMYNES